jgi:excisionase family DNA binding protein
MEEKTDIGYPQGAAVIEGWLTQDEAAKKLRIAVDTMRRYVREGKFPRTKVGKRYLIPARGIEEFLQSGLVTGPRAIKPRIAKPRQARKKKH